MSADYFTPAIVLAISATLSFGPSLPAQADPLAPEGVSGSSQAAPHIVPGNQGPGVESAASAAVLDYVTRPAPPPSFDYMAATDEELRTFGLPPRPDPVRDPKAHAFWKKMMAASKHRVTPILQRTNIFHGPPKNLAQVASQQIPPTAGDGPTGLRNISKPTTPPNLVNTTVSSSTNWSGYANYEPLAPYNSSKSFVLAEWTVPFAQQAFGVCTGGWEYSSEWPGFDGLGSNDVLQAGSESDAYCLNGATQQFYSLWYEWYPAASVRITNLSIAPGNLIEAYIWYSTTAPLGNAYLVNLTNNTSTYIGFNPPAGTTFQGTSAEWIVEAPTVNSSQSLLTNYTVVPWNYALAYSTSRSQYAIPTYTATGTAYNINMVSGGATISSCGYSSPYALWCIPAGSAL